MKILGYWKHVPEIRIGIGIIIIALLSGCIFFPQPPTTPHVQMDDAYVLYDDEYTIAEGEGYGNGTVVLSNVGTTNVEIVSLSVYYADSVSPTANWTEIDDHDKLDITADNPYVIVPLVALEELTVRFLIPEDNNDNPISYRITITTKGGDVLDTAEVANVYETEMQLKKDRPNISFTGTLDYVRRNQTISPTSVSDNSAIKNVTYQVYNSTWSMTNTITSSPWQWVTFDNIANGSYTLKMTVYDYAGLSATVDDIPLTFENDYVSPTLRKITFV